MRRVASLVAVVAVVAVVSSSCSVGRTGSAPPADAPSAKPVSATTAPGVRRVRTLLPRDGVFGPRSEWRRNVSGAPVGPDSAGIVANLAEQVSSRYGGIAALNVWAYNDAVYTVRGKVPRRKVRFDDCQGKGYVPDQLYDRDRGAHFRGVPIPRGARPAAGTDGSMSIYDPRRDTLWELWKADKRADGWYACWGGRIDDVSTSPGYFPDGMGVAATGLSLTGGVIRVKEARAGVIDHALSLAVVDAAHWSDYSYPAQRSDGNLPVGTSGPVEEGRRLRLDPTLDVDSLGLTPLATMVARAAQIYGFIVTDRAGAVALSTESGSGYAARHGTNPWPDLLGSAKAYNVLAGFPWDRLQALPRDYGKRSAADPSR